MLLIETQYFLYPFQIKSHFFVPQRVFVAGLYLFVLTAPPAMLSFDYWLLFEEIQYVTSIANQNHTHIVLMKKI